MEARSRSVAKIYELLSARFDLHLLNQQGLERQVGALELCYPVQEFFEQIVVPEGQIILLGKPQLYLLQKFTKSHRDAILMKIVPTSAVMIILADGIESTEVVEIATEHQVIVAATLSTVEQVIHQIMSQRKEDSLPETSCHGTLVEAFGVGVLIQGDSAVGKSEAALGLIERGHRLVSDDVVKVRLMDGFLEGSGPDLTAHLLEIRGIGILNVAHLHGAICVRDRKRIDLAIRLEKWSDQAFYDRVGLDERYCQLLDVQVPYYVLPVKPGRDVVLLIETIVLNHRLKEMGYNSAREFNVKLLERIASRQREGV